MKATDPVYLGVDLGAESGRVMAGIWDGRKMQLDELHRFANGGVMLGDTLRWDVVRLWSEIQTGLAVGARRFGRAVRSVGVDTWGVDYVLLSKSNELLGLPFHYRDGRTRGMLARAFQRVPREEIFHQTGVQFMEINSLFQLLVVQQNSPEILGAADCFLTIPDFLNWCLTGRRVCEFSNATTTQCYHPIQRAWATDLLGKFGLPTHLFPEVVPPGTLLGPLRTSLAQSTGLGPVGVIAPATHDTGSAVAGIPTSRTGQADWAYISSGTWSLMGVEIQDALITPRALELNFTNEGGVDGTFRLLKNIIGLWLVQQCKRAFESEGRHYDYAELVRRAGEAPPLRSFVDPEDPRFLNPPNMPAAMQQFCRDTGQPVPETDGALVRCALESLALKYSQVLASLEELTGTAIKVIHVVGGGSQNRLLNAFTTNACQRPVLAGPVEATVLGNLLVQARAAGELQSLADLRAAVRASSDVHEFEPDPEVSAGWEGARRRFATLQQRR